MDSKALDIFVGKKLGIRRKELGLKQRELAELIELSHQQVQKYEKGQNRIGASTLYAIAHVLTVDIAYFFEGYEKANSPQNTIKRKKEKSAKYGDLSVGTIEELVKAFSALPPTARRNMLTLIKGFSSKK